MALTANLLRRRALYKKWHRNQSQSHILRSQLGFSQVEEKRPRVCVGCIHYHGKAYGYNRHNRTRLICGFYPYGFLGHGVCPEKQEEI